MSFCILVANEPRSYCEVISAAIRALRPLAEVFVAEPEDLDTEVARLLPDLVVCSSLSDVVEESVPAWIELYPGGSENVTVSLEGDRIMLTRLGFDRLLSIVDQAERLRRSARAVS